MNLSEMRAAGERGESQTDWAKGPVAEFPQRRCGGQHPIRYPERAMPGVNI